MSGLRLYAGERYYKTTARAAVANIRHKANREQRKMTKQALQPRMRVKGKYVVKQPIHYFTRFVSRGTLNGTSGTSSSFGVKTFKISDVAGYAEFSAIYDFYKISAIQIRFIPAANVTTTTVQQTFYSNRFFSVLDYNDNTTPTSLNDLREYGNCKMTPGTKIHKRFFKPKLQVAVDEDGGAGSSYGVVQFPKNPWVSMGSNQTEYFAIKYGLEHPSLSANTELYVIECKYYLQFKSTK